MDSRLEQRGSAGSTSVAHGRAARGAGSVTAVPCDGLFRFAETNSHRNNDCYTFMGGGSYRTDTDPGMSKPQVAQANGRAGGTMTMVMPAGEAEGRIGIELRPFGHPWMLPEAAVRGVRARVCAPKAGRPAGAHGAQPPRARRSAAASRSMVPREASRAEMVESTRAV